MGPSCNLLRERTLPALLNFKTALLLASLSLLTPIAAHAAPGTAFTYQGRLTNGSAALETAVDLRFTAWTAATDGTQLGTAVTVLNTAHPSGLVLQNLDFGAIFGGSPVYLQIELRSPADPGDTGAYTALTPRVELKPTPYAISAENAEKLGGFDASSFSSATHTHSTITSGSSTITLTNVGRAVVAGSTNAVSADNAVVVGGGDNRATSQRSTVLGGRFNVAGGADENGIVGGFDNEIAAGTGSGIMAGTANVITQSYSGTLGGRDNRVSGLAAGTVAGRSLDASGEQSVALGGFENVVGGTFNNAIVGGEFNEISGGEDSAIVGGYDNVISQSYGGTLGAIESTVSGLTSGAFATRLATVSAEQSAVIGGYTNTAGGAFNNVIVGGQFNEARDGSHSAILAGENNIAEGTGSATIAGKSNTAGGSYSVAIGGEGNLVSGNNSVSIGSRAINTHNGTIMITDGQATDFESAADNQVLIRAENGVGINRNNPLFDLDVQGSGRFTSDLFVENDVSVGGNTSVEDLQVNQAFIAYGPFTSGQDSLFENKLTVQGASALEGGLTVTGATKLNTGLDVTGATALNNGLTVTGSTFLGTGLTVNGGIDLNGPVTIAAPATVESDLTLSRGTDTSGLTRRLVIGGARTSAPSDYASLDFKNLDNNSSGTEYVGAAIRSVNDDSSDNGDLRFHTNNGTLTERMIIQSNGNVGIGTSTPSQPLTVQGSASVGNGAFVDQSNEFSDAGALGPSLSQTFTPAVDGLLVAVSFRPNADNVPGSGVVTIHRTSTSNPAISSQAYSFTTGATGWVRIPLSTAPILRAGQVYAMRFAASSGSHKLGASDNTDRYAGGRANTTSALADLMFRTEMNTSGLYLGDGSFLRTANQLGDGIVVVDSEGQVGINNGGPEHPFVVGTSTTNGNGAHVTNGGTWTNGSSRTWKSNFRALDARDVLTRVLALPITRWEYTGANEGDHIGPVAEDFHKAFGLGQSEKYISTVDADGVALAAIQGLNAKLEAENKALREKNAEIEARLARLEAHLSANAEVKP